MLVPFAQYFPKLAFDECRFIFLVPNGAAGGIESADETLALIEFYCPDLNCNCRRVILQVFSQQLQQPLCSISYAFDRDDPMSGPFIDPLNPAVENADEVLEFVESQVLSDPDYVARLERHYELLRDAVRRGQVVATPKRAREVIAEKRKRLKKRHRALKRK
jgi:hypothetical protein